MKEPIEISGFSNVAIASYVTAYARIHMHKLIRPIFDEAYYMDTDSIFTTASLASSKELGQLKKEGEAMEKACFLLPKTYIAGPKIVMKGFEKRKIAHFTFDDFEAQLSGEFRLKAQTEAKLARFKTALRHGKFLHISKPTSKQIRSAYDKRRLIRDKNGNWDTEPVNL